MLTFQRFQDAGLAREFAQRLEEAGIPVFLEDESKFFNISFASNPLVNDINLKINRVDFVRARKALEDFFEPRINEIEPDYYLFSFTVEELEEIVAKPDEWGVLDYLLAQKILREKGRELAPDNAEMLKSERVKNLANPHSVHILYLILYYLLALLISFFGLFVGGWLYYSRKILPNGEKVFAYARCTRNHGLALLIIGGLFTVLRLLGLVVMFDPYYLFMRL